MNNAEREFKKVVESGDYPRFDDVIEFKDSYSKTKKEFNQIVSRFASFQSLAMALEYFDAPCTDDEKSRLEEFGQWVNDIANNMFRRLNLW